MTTIKHTLYKEFYKEGMIKLITPQQFKDVYNSITDAFGREALTIMYYTGCRPVQILKNFTTANITKDGNDIKILLHPAKNGLPTTAYVNFNRFGITQLWRTCQSLPPDTPLFASFSGDYVRSVTNNKGVVKNYVERADKFRYYFKKWFSSIMDEPIPPYYLRHSRMSSLSQQGATPDDIRLAKGSKRFDSVTPYMHMSKERAKKISKMVR